MTAEMSSRAREWIVGCRGKGAVALWFPSWVVWWRVPLIELLILSHESPGTAHRDDTAASGIHDYRERIRSSVGKKLSGCPGALNADSAVKKKGSHFQMVPRTDSTAGQ